MVPLRSLPRTRIVATLTRTNPLTFQLAPSNFATPPRSRNSAQQCISTSAPSLGTLRNKVGAKRSRLGRDPENNATDGGNAFSRIALDRTTAGLEAQSKRENSRTMSSEPITRANSKSTQQIPTTRDPTSLSFLPLPSPNVLHQHTVSFSRPLHQFPSQNERHEIQVQESGMILLIPLLAFLKSSAALNAVTVISRLALTLLPLSLRAKILHKTRTAPLASDASLAGAPDGSKGSSRWGFGGETVGRINAKILLPILVGLPVLLLGATIIASLERVPITARWRTIMLGPEEEEALVQSILDAGSSSSLTTPRSGPTGQLGGTTKEGMGRDWISILNSVLQLEEGGRSGETGRRIFLGGEVLDERDWRYRWTMAALRNLERGVSKINISPLSSSSSLVSVAGPTAINGPIPPPSHHPLRPRRRTDTLPISETGREDEFLLVEYDLIVVERDEPNAFSFGFSPEEKQVGGKRGVVVVYTGFLDEILNEKFSPSVAPQKSSFFSSLLPSSSRRSGTTVDLDSMNNPPNGRPTREESNNLSVLLAHELSHLILSHTLESYASTTLLLPALSKMCLDVIRTLIFPITALAGPFVSDAIGKSLDQAQEFKTVGRMLDSCGSRRLELEADLVGLRLLSNAGIDPTIAITFWETRLSKSLLPTSPSINQTPHPSSRHLQSYSPITPRLVDNSLITPQRLENSLTPRRLEKESGGRAEDGSGEFVGGEGRKEKGCCGFFETHPIDSERIEMIRAELKRWEVSLS